MIPYKEPQKIYPGNRCAEYFKEMLESAEKNQQTEVSETTEFYLVNLLHESVRTENVFLPDDPNKDEPLTQKLDRALNADYYEKIKRFKDLGDFTLFISGFFPDSLERKLVDVDYYMVVGGIAYNNLSLIMKDKVHGEVFSSLYGELSEKFVPIADLLTEVSQKSSAKKSANLLRAYERWVKTNSQRDANWLKQEGIVPTENVKSNYLQ